MFWGDPTIPGSLCQLREYIRRVQVDKGVKYFNVGDEFLLHAFKGHLLAAICNSLSVEATDSIIEHTKDAQWLRNKAEMLVECLLFPSNSIDPVLLRQSRFLHTAFLYIDLRNAIRWEDGLHIIRHWKWWLPRFIGTGKKNYAKEAALVVCHLCADFPKRIAYIATHNRTVNTLGKPGHGKPIDQLMEHYNL